MRWLALVLLVALPASAQDRFPRCRSAQGRSDRGFACADAEPFFSFAPASGAGLGAPCACAAVTGAKGETVTFARTSTGYCTKTLGGMFATTGIANGDMVSCASGQPRIETSPNSVLSAVQEASATNNIVQSEGLDTASYANQVTGVAAATVTADQATTPWSTLTAERVQFPATAVAQESYRYQAAGCPGGGPIVASGYLKGNGTSGTICLFINQAGTFNYRMCSYNPTTWTRCYVASPATAAGNWSIGNESISGVCDGQAAGAQDIFISGAQCELGAIPSTYIPTTAAIATRNTETWQANVPITVNTESMSAYEYTRKGGGNGTAPYSFATLVHGTATDLVKMAETTANVCAVIGASVPVVTSLTIAPPGSHTHSCSWTGTGAFGTIDQSPFAAGAGATVATRTTLYMGYDPFTANYELNGHFARVRVDPAPGVAGGVIGYNAPIASLGDSITQGISIGIGWPSQLALLLPTRTVDNFGVSGYTTSQVATAYTNQVVGRGFSTLVILAGVNDVRTLPDSAAVIFARLQAVYDDARGRGQKVVPVTVLPFSSAAGWTAGMQTVLTALNALILNYCTTNSITCVDAYNSVLRTGTALTAIYDVGDGLHPNAAGEAVLASLIQAASP